MFSKNLTLSLFINRVTVPLIKKQQSFEIPLTKTGRSHLIITGKNGSGKTTALNQINDFMQRLINQGQFYIQSKDEIDVFNKGIKSIKNSIDKINLEGSKSTIKNFEEKSVTRLDFNTYSSLKDAIDKGEFVYYYFKSKRDADFNTPTAIQKSVVTNRIAYNQNARAHFVQHLVNKRAEQSFARDDNAIDVENDIKRWFQELEDKFKLLFNDNSLQLLFDRKALTFNISLSETPTFPITTMSDGYAASLAIISELIMRMEYVNSKFYEVQGLVLIDEVETHLHVALQKKILPLLTSFFPNIQFFTTTHSPFVISSLSNAIVCDLDKEFIVEDLTGYSYDAIIESYYDSDKYSEVLKVAIIEYEMILNKSELSIPDRERINELKQYFSGIPKYLAPELDLKLNQLELRFRDKL